MNLKAPITFFIGIAVFMLCLSQFYVTHSLVRLGGTAIGLFLLILGWKIGWTGHRKFTVLCGHIFMTTGCFVTAYALYQIPYLAAKPGLLMVLDLPLFWGLFCIAGGYCMINHGCCSCTIRMHNEANGQCPK